MQITESCDLEITVFVASLNPDEPLLPLPMAADMVYRIVHCPVLVSLTLDPGSLPVFPSAFPALARGSLHLINSAAASMVPDS